MKKLLAAFLAIVLIVTLIPPGIVQKADAATTATYFIPDNELRETATLTTNVAPPDPLNPPNTALSRNTAYHTNKGTITVTGALAIVSGNTLSAKVEQLNLNPNGTWSVDANNFTTGTIIVDPQNSNRFIASNLPLFSGMNKITFTGLQNGLQRSDVFYVLFDKVPYIQSLKVTSGNTLVDLNEGAQAVVQNGTVSIQGVAVNATRVTAGIAGGTQVVSTVYEDGMFFTPAFALKSGKNTINLTITNGSNTINVVREIYYFDRQDPFTSVQLQIGAASAELKGSTPQITDNNTTANLKVQMLVEYGAAVTPFAGTATFSVNNSVYGTIGNADVSEELVIPGPDGITPAYRLVTFELPSTFPLQQTAGNYNKDQNVNLSITYGTYSAAFSGRFKYLPGETVITNMYYLPNYNGTTDVKDASREPLNNAEVNDSTFYILVESDKDISAAAYNTLNSKLLPVSTTNLTITHLTPANTSANAANQRVYRVSGFPNGQQKVEFNFAGSSATYLANIAYISKSYIYIANLYDGQSITYDSKLTNNTLAISGEYIGFTGNVGSPQLFINGKEFTDHASVGTFVADVTGTGKFNLSLPIGGANPIVFGENRIVLQGVNVISSGNTQTITKEIKVYIIDKNEAKIAKFMPTLDDAQSREAIDSSDLTAGYTADEINRIFSVTPEFQYDEGKYTTSEYSYDLVMRGSGARTLNLKIGSETMYTYAIPPEEDNDPQLAHGIFNFNGVDYRYDFAGDERDFIFRVQSISFATPGTHVYNLELINGTGARIVQPLEITREVSAYRLLAPRATVGDQIIVNKNFIRFDIEAEGATEVIIGKDGVATKRSDMNDRFVYDYVGLKPNATTKIDIQIKRADSTLKNSVQVYYSDTVQLDTQYMEKLGTKHSVFGKKLQLTFPKGTVLKSESLNNLMAPKLYTDTKLLFGIANPSDGVVERRNDYGEVINVDYDSRTVNGASSVTIPDYIALRFASNANTNNFTRISNIYWISGGIGESGNKGEVGYKPATNGLAPYSIEGNFTEYDAGRKVVPSNRGSLTLTYDESVVEEVGYTVTVFRYTDRGVWENIGGVVNTKNHTITVPFEEFGYYQVMKLRKSFNDITNHGWARNILNALYSKGIMSNMRVDEFGANDLTTRGEFVTLIVKGLNLPLKDDGNQTFFDITPGTRTATWDYEHIETAARAGIVNGLSEGFFGPDIRITREDAAVMIAKALQLKMSVNNDKLASNLAKSFVDSGSIHIYARPAVEAVNKAKIMTGSPTTIPGQTKPLYSFNPRGNMTRAEAAKIAVALFQKSTSLFPKNLS